MKYYLQLAISLALVWLLWSFHFTPLLLTMGGLSILLVLWVVHRMRIVDEEASLVDLRNVRTALYAPWLIWQIVKANLDVARVILTPGLPIEPRMVRVPSRQRTALGKVIYANSITLTPGTVTVGFEDEESVVVVHALTRTAFEDLVSGEMGERVRLLEKGG